MLSEERISELLTQVRLATALLGTAHRAASESSDTPAKDREMLAELVRDLKCYTAALGFVLKGDKPQEGEAADDFFAQARGHMTWVDTMTSGILLSVKLRRTDISLREGGSIDEAALEKVLARCGRQTGRTESSDKPQPIQEN